TGVQTGALPISDSAAALGASCDRRRLGPCLGVRFVFAIPSAPLGRVGRGAIDADRVFVHEPTECRGHAAPPAADCNRLGHGRDAMQRVVAAGPPEETETP